MTGEAGADAMRRRRAPIWLMGLANATMGVSGAVMLLTVPQLLAADHVPEPRIAEITGLGLMPSFLSFVVAPILDVRFSRRTYAVITAALSGLFTFLALLSRHQLPIMAWLLFASSFAAQLNIAAIGGWLGSLVSEAEEGRLGAWFNVGNVGAFGITAIVGITVLRVLPYAVGAGLLGALCAAPLLVFPFIPAPGPDRRLARESFGRFARDLAGLVRRPQVLLTLLFFAVPAASFALTNTLGGLGRDFAASERFVALIGGAGVTVAGIAGSLMAPPLARRLSPRWLYLSIGVVGAIFTLLLIFGPRTPTSFMVAMIGENVAQSGAFTAANLVMFRAIGKDNPFAATQFALMLAAQMLPLTYMQVLDGRGYGWRGVTGAYLVDGGCGIAACAFLALLLTALARRRARGPALA